MRQQAVETHAISAVLLNAYQESPPKKLFHSKSSLTFGRRSARTGKPRLLET